MKLSDKALEDFKLSVPYLNIKKITGSTVVNYVVYHNWLNEQVEKKYIDILSKNDDVIIKGVTRYKLYEMQEL